MQFYLQLDDNVFPDFLKFSLSKAHPRYHATEKVCGTTKFFLQSPYLTMGAQT